MSLHSFLPPTTLNHLQPQGGAIQCAGCENIIWCSKECRAAADRQHLGMECECMAKLDVTLLNEGDAALAKLFVKILCARAQDDGAQGFEESVGMLESNVDKIDVDRLSELGMVMLLCPRKLVFCCLLTPFVLYIPSSCTRS